MAWCSLTYYSLNRNPSTVRTAVSSKISFRSKSIVFFPKYRGTYQASQRNRRQSQHAYQLAQPDAQREPESLRHRPTRKRSHESPQMSLSCRAKGEQRDSDALSQSKHPCPPFSSRQTGVYPLACTTVEERPFRAASACLQKGAFQPPCPLLSLQSQRPTRRSGSSVALPFFFVATPKLPE